MCMAIVTGAILPANIVSVPLTFNVCSATMRDLCIDLSAMLVVVQLQLTWQFQASENVKIAHTDALSAIQLQHAFNVLEDST